MSHYDERAARLQSMNRESEGIKSEMYDDDAARRAAVYTREDMAMVVSYLSSLNDQIASLRFIAWIVVALLAFLIFQRI